MAIGLRTGVTGRLENGFLVFAVCALKALDMLDRVYFTFSDGGGLFAPVVSCAAAFIVLLLLLLAMRRSPEKDIIEMITDTFGGFLGRIIVIVLAILLLCGAANTLVHQGTLLRFYFFPRTPFYWIYFLFFAAILPMVWIGMESLARAARFVGVLFGAVFLLIMLFGLSGFRITNIYPLFGDGLPAIVKNGFAIGFGFFDILAFAMIASGGKRRAYWRKPMLWGLGAATVFVLFVGVCINLLIGNEAMSLLPSSFFEMVSLSINKNLLKYFAPVTSFALLTTVCLSSAFSLYGASYALSKIFGLKDSRPFALVSCTLCFLVCILATFEEAAFPYAAMFIMQYGWIAMISLPLLANIRFTRQRKAGDLI